MAHRCSWSTPEDAQGNHNATRSEMQLGLAIDKGNTLTFSYLSGLQTEICIKLFFQVRKEKANLVRPMFEQRSSSLEVWSPGTLYCWNCTLDSDNGSVCEHYLGTDFGIRKCRKEPGQQEGWWVVSAGIPHFQNSKPSHSCKFL